MPDVTVRCDRCKKTIEDYRTDEVTAGFYEITRPDGWARFCNPGERIVCDECMWSDPRYIAVYGARTDAA